MIHRLIMTLVFSGVAFAAPLHLNFIHVAGKKPLLMDSLRYQNHAKETYSLTRLDWLASDISFTTTSGEVIEFPKKNIFVSTRRGALTLPDMPAKQIAFITFHIGPNAKANHSAPSDYPVGHPLHPEVNKLHWDWEGGYIFMALEGHWRLPEQRLPSGFAYHFARDGNRRSVTLPLSINSRDELRVTIGLDVNSLLENLSFRKDGATTHSAENDVVALQLKKNLGKAFQVVAIEKGGVPAPLNAPKPIDLPVSPKGYPITLPRHVPIPPLPSDNPILISRVALGNKLFHDPRLSRNNTISCASCHQGKLLNDSRRFSAGIDGKHHNRHTMPLFNLAWKSSFFWDGRVTSLREQVLLPIEDHLEMDESLENVIQKIKDDSSYASLFTSAFGSGEINSTNIGLSLENFLLTRISLDSKFDQSVQGKVALSPEEKRGFELFFTESEPRLGKYGADCFHCHGGALFSDHQFHNNGLLQTDDRGLGKVTGKASDRYKFSTPSLRNIALTAPYMHDGRFKTLEEVIDHYNGDFMLSSTLDPHIAKHPDGLNLSEYDKKALIAFLKTLSDPAIVAP